MIPCSTYFYCIEAAFLNPDELAPKVRGIMDAVETAVMGKTHVVEMALAVLLSNGHLLIEDIPGVGKTTLAKALARALGLTFKRIQFTPDLLPSDITGSSMFNQKTQEFEMMPGPVFANIVLADEINRTTPKTQAALLECMEERQVTIDGTTYHLPSPFFVIATQNNIELTGTYPLPEAQLDRFAARVAIGHPDRAAELQILSSGQHSRPVDSVPAVVDATQILQMQSAVRDVHVDPEVQGYIVDVVAATRTLPAVLLGASTRGAQNLLHTAQAYAALKAKPNQEVKVLPDDIKEMARIVLPHRIMVRPEQRVRGVTALACVEEALRAVPVPLP
jgi:MoxR-like ATPase